MLNKPGCEPLLSLLEYHFCVQKFNELKGAIHFKSRSSKGTCMQHVLIIHEVEAYPAWKAIFDQAADIRKRAGEISYQLLRYDNDANNIVHFSEWSSLDNARRFFESQELVEIRMRAGVKMPDFIYLHEIERGVL